MNKQCFRCGEDLPLSAFYKHPGMKDGRLNKCKPCTRVDVKNNRDLKVDRYRKYEQERSKTPKRKKQMRRYAISDKGKAAMARATKAYRKKYPNRYRAQTMVNNAIRDGKMKKMPCEICGSNDRIHAHHDDYSFPLNVRWLCAAHHSEWHRENEPENPS